MKIAGYISGQTASIKVFALRKTNFAHWLSLESTREDRNNSWPSKIGVRESTQSWREVLLKLKSRGMNVPQLAIGDGAIGFWAAMDEVYPQTRQQRCWVHKTANILNSLPKSSQPKAKEAIHQIWQAETKINAEKAFELFIETYQDKYPKATLSLQKDREELLAFYDFPAKHW
jgi:putative transposase